MKTNLSSQIKLDRVPKKYYAPTSEIELASLTLNEKLNTKILETPAQGAEYIAKEIATTIRRFVDTTGKCVLGLGTGENTLKIYEELVNLYKQGEVSFKNVIVFNLYEFFPIDETRTPSTTARLREVFLNQVDITPGNFHKFDVNTTIEDILQFCHYYEADIEKCGGLDLAICEIGQLGTLAFNEPGSSMN